MGWLVVTVVATDVVACYIACNILFLSFFRLYFLVVDSATSKCGKNGGVSFAIEFLFFLLYQTKTKVFLFDCLFENVILYLSVAAAAAAPAATAVDKDVVGMPAYRLGLGCSLPTTT